MADKKTDLKAQFNNTKDSHINKVDNAKSKALKKMSNAFKKMNMR